MKEKKQDEIYIKIMKNGPYLVYGCPILKQEFMTPNEDGAVWEYEEGKILQDPCNEKPVALCRCGCSKNAPFCDGSHNECGFDGTETADNKPILEDAVAYEGPEYTLLDNEVYCAFARFCDAYGRVWNLIEEGGEEANAMAMREAFHCPAGRLMIQDNKTGEILEPDLEKSISVLEDVDLGCSGPLFVKGGIKIEGSDGRVYEIRNRVTLCRCGKSENKPFCDGKHAAVKYKDNIK